MDRADPLARLALWLAFGGLLTCGLTALVAIPLAAWAAVSGRRRGVRASNWDTALLSAAVSALSLYIGGRLLAEINHSRQISATSDCMYRLKQINLAALAYAKDHDGHMPPAEGWTDALRPYMREPLFQCPSARRGAGGYAYNIAVAGKKWEPTKGGASVVTFFDGSLGHDALGGPRSAVYRHVWFPEDLKQAVFALAGGTVQVRTADSVDHLRWRSASR